MQTSTTDSETVAKAVEDLGVPPMSHHRFLPMLAWLSVWGIIGVCSAILHCNMPPSKHFVYSGMVLNAACWLSAGMALGGVAYTATIFVLYRTVRHMLYKCAFAALAGGGVLQALFGATNPQFHIDDRLFLAAWLYAGVVFAGGARSTTKMGRGRFFRSLAQLTTAALTAAAFPAVLTVYALNLALYDKFRTFPNETWASQTDNAIALIAALFLAAAILGRTRLCISSYIRLDSTLYAFLGACLVALIWRAQADVTGGSIWFASWLIVSLAWFVLAMGFAKESALTHKELADRIQEAEALQDLSWSLVGTRCNQDFLSLFAETVREKLCAQIVAVYLTDPERKCLELAALSGVGEDLPSAGTTYIIDSDSPRPGFHSGHTADAFRSGQMRVADDIFIDVEFVPWRTVAKGDGRAISLPLIDQQKAFGVLNVYFADHRQITPQRVVMLRTLAAAASPAIARVWTDTRPNQVDKPQLDLAA